MKKAVPFGLGLRIKRICSKDNDFQKHRENLKTRLLERHYPVSVVDTELRKVDQMNRNRVSGARLKGGDGKGVPMAITFSKYTPNVKAILRSKRHLLHRSQNLRKIFPVDPMVAYKRGRNLRDMLVHRKTRQLTYKRDDRKAESCGKECVICRRIYGDSERVAGARDGCVTTYDRTIGCKSANVIYGIWCDVCKYVCYVGETGGCLYTRVQNHLSSIRAVNPAVVLPVRSHFCAPGHNVSDVRVVGLERVWSQSVEYRRVRERRWMGLLGTNGTVGGFNKRCG